MIGKRPPGNVISYFSNLKRLPAVFLSLVGGFDNGLEVIWLTWGVAGAKWEVLRT